MPGRRWPVIGLLSALLLLPAAHHAGAADGGFSFVGEECPELVAAFSVPAQRADDFVPEGFQVLVDAMGSATVVVAVAACARITLNGRGAGSAILSDVGIAIHSPDGSAGEHIYQLWQPTDNGELRSLMDHVGMRGGLVKEAGATFLPGLEPVLSAADMPWRPSPYTVRTTSAALVPLPPGSNTWWHTGEYGVVRVTYDFLNAELGVGVATVWAEPGSPLAALVGSGNRIAERGGLIVHHLYRGQITLVESP
jgi:hypothetical protein